MTEQKKRRRRPRGGSGTVAAVAPGVATTPGGRVLPELPVWRWKTLPVYFALTGGLFVGLYVGIAVGFFATDRGNETPMTVTLIIAALLFGFALSRVTSRFLITRGILKPRPRRK